MHEQVAAIEKTREEAGIPRSRVLARSGVSSSTFNLWRTGAAPSLKKLDAFREAVQDLIQEQAVRSEALAQAGIEPR